METVMIAGTRKVSAVAVAALLLGALAGCGNNSKEPGMTSTSTTAGGAVTPAQARDIAKQAYIYGFPMVDNYRIFRLSLCG
jgi:hypothetical protein